MGVTVAGVCLADVGAGGVCCVGVGGATCSDADADRVGGVWVDCPTLDGDLVADRASRVEPSEWCAGVGDDDVVASHAAVAACGVVDGCYTDVVCAVGEGEC